MNKKLFLKLFVMSITFLCFNNVKALDNIPSQFKDENFYQCVLDNYRRQVSPHVSTDYLEQEELNKIKEIMCGDYHVEKNEVKTDGIYYDVSGIETLPNIEVLLIGTSNSELDFSNNKKIRGANIIGPNITSLNLKENEQLTNLRIASPVLTSLNLPNNTTLDRLMIFNSNLSEIDLAQYIDLAELTINAPKMKSLDLSKNINLAQLNINVSNMPVFPDLSNNVNLNELSFFFEMPNEYCIDLSKNINLEDIYIKQGSFVDSENYVDHFTPQKGTEFEYSSYDIIKLSNKNLFCDSNNNIKYEVVIVPPTGMDSKLIIIGTIVIVFSIVCILVFSKKGNNIKRNN